MRSGGRGPLTVTAFGQLLLCLSFALLASSIPPKPWKAGGHFQFGLNFAQKRNFENSNSSMKALAEHDKYENYFTQKIDHFGIPTNTFQQRYFVNKQWASNAHIHILHLDLETSSDVVTDVTLPHVANAKELKATVWSLEHRFYGASQPFGGDVSVDSLKYLTVDQVIEDIADFINAQNSASGETDAKWILYGGAYEGALALWFHQKYYSSLSFGVVSSSALYQTTVDYYQFEKNVEDTYAAFSSDCLAGISHGLGRLRQMIQNEKGRNAVSKTLKTSPNLNDEKLTYNELQLLNWMVALFVQVPVIFNGVAEINGGQVGDVCAVFQSSGQADYLKLVEVVQLVGQAVFSSNSFSIDVDYDGFVDHFKSGSDRNLLWQACNELGSFTTSDYGHLAVGSSIPNNFWLGLCASTFGPEYNIDNLKKGVNYTSTVYGFSKAYQAPNTIITVGSVDPCRSLGVAEVTDRSSIIYTIDGSGMCADTYPPSNTDSSSLSSVRTSITKKLKSWVSKGNENEELVKEVKQKPTKHSESPSTAQKIKNMNAKIEWNRPRPNEKELYEKLKEKKQKIQLSGQAQLDISRTNTFPKKMERVYEKYLAGESANIESIPYGVNYGLIEQDLDHFDASNSKTYKQLFINNNEFADPSRELVFLMIGGESPINWIYVSYYLAMGEFAMVYNADMYVLEHRYYGESIPTDDISVDSLQWLTSEQALADAAVFISSVNSYKNYKNPKWVLFGGSYPGSLVAWHRLKYPELSVGGIASSAPVQAKTDLFEYLQVVNEATKKYGEGDCAKNIHSFFKWHQQKLNSAKGRQEISQIWGICPAWGVEPYKSDKDVELLLAGIVFAVAGDVQYDDDGHDYVYYICEVFEYIDSEILGVSDEDDDDQAQLVKIKKVVERLRPRIFPYTDENGNDQQTTNVTSKVKEPSPLKNLLRPHRHHSNSKKTKFAKAAQLTAVLERDDEQSSESSSSTMEEYDELFCYRVNYAQYIDFLKIDAPVDSSDRCWTYTTCKELGVFQSTNIGPNAFESALPVNFQVDLCTELFGPKFTRAGIDANVDFTNKNYGGQYNYNGTNTVFVNGSEDPWHVLSVYPPYIKDGSNVTSILINGTSHCADMYSFIIEEGTNIMQAKKSIKRTIRSWIK